MFCKKCGNELDESVCFCPKCGTPQVDTVTIVNSAGQQQEKNLYNAMAITGFVIALVSLKVNFWGIFGIVAFATSCGGYQSCEQNKQKGKGLAAAGIIIAALSTIWKLVVFLGGYSLLFQ